MRAKTAVREPESVLAGDAAGAMTGARYIESLQDGREVWIDGERVDDVTAHPAFKDMIDELARVYDLQNSPQYRDEMTFVDPETGVRTSVSWLLPRSADDLKRKRRNSELWNELTWGQLGRSPDILAPYIISALHLKDEFSKVKHPHCDFGENLDNYYKYCLRNDLFLTHALGDPQVDRSEQPQNEQREVREDEEVALHVVEETKDGVIVTGGKQLSTAAPHSQRMLRLAVGDVRAAQRSELRARLFDPDQLAGPEDPGARAGVALVRLVGPSAADARRAGLHAVLRPRAGAVGPALHALRSDADGEDARRRRRQRQFQLPGLGESLPRVLCPHAADDRGRDDGRRGDRRHRVSRGRAPSSARW